MKMTTGGVPMVSQHQATAPCKTVLVWLIIALISSTLAWADEQALRGSFAQDNFVIREEMIPMRDGVKLYTVIVSPKEDSGVFPVMLERTPYNASGAISGRTSPRMARGLRRQDISR
jgi:predicted acyl esterase